MGETITKGCVTILTGQPGIGKSTLVRYLIAAVVSGKSYLGSASRSQGAVALIADYETPEVFRDSFWRDVYGEAITEVENVYLTERLPMVNGIGSATALIAEIRDADCDLLVIDTISAAFLIDEENSVRKQDQLCFSFLDHAGLSF